MADTEAFDCLAVDGTVSGVALLSSNALEVSLTAKGISWRITGGIIDFYVMGGQRSRQGCP